MDAFRVYLGIRFLSSLFFATIVTVNLVYQATVVGLNPLQLVLVGTVLEATLFLLEIPTGVLADTYSRKWSVIIGVTLFGGGFMVEALFPTFFCVLLSQVIWGAGYTFISGAREAWISDEIGEDKAGQAFLSGEQIAQIGAIIGVIASVVLASINIRLPIFIGGLLYSLQAIWLLLFMPEKHFHPTPQGQRSTWQHLTSNLFDGVTIVRTNRILLLILLIGGIFGAFSEGIDRLWTTYVIHTFEFPTLGQLPTVTWFGIISIGAMLLTTLATHIAKKTIDTSSHSSIARGSLLINGGIFLATLGFGLAGGFYSAITFYWILQFLRQTDDPIQTAWVNQHTTSQTRATIISFSSQFNALGQMAGGPLLGLIATYISLRMGIIGAALSLIPMLVLFLYLNFSKRKSMI